jgi:hypothetical protein
MRFIFNFIYVVCGKQKIPLRVWKREYSLSFYCSIIKNSSLTLSHSLPASPAPGKDEKEVRKEACAGIVHDCFICFRRQKYVFSFVRQTFFHFFCNFVSILMYLCVVSDFTNAEKRHG